MRESHRIHLILDGKDYGIRYWKNVPRVGECVMLKEYRSDNFFIAMVAQVAWGVAVDDADTNWPDINMKLTRDDKIRSD